MPRTFRYCPHCATAFSAREIGGLERMVCPSCHFVFWQNPVVGVAVIVLRDTRVLLGRRVGGVYEGAWCIPCGYVEYDEDVRDAARREFREETGLVVELGEVFTVHSNFHAPAMHSVGIWFRGDAVGGRLQAGDDIDVVDFFALDALPEPLAFPTDRLVLHQLRSERRDGARR